jgi:DNA-binding response OmpR family regulator
MARTSGPHRTPVTPLFLNLAGEEAKPRVLVVDDEDTVSSAIATLLMRRGCEAVTANSGTAALARMREEYFDVILCDVRMPGMTGLEFLSEALLLDRDLPVMMLSGSSDLATARDALARGAMDYLTKPIELTELDLAVRAATRHRRHEIERQRVERLTSGEVKPSETVELHGGPLAGRKVHLEDRRFRLWVVVQPDGERVWAAVERPPNLPEGTRVLGAYGFSRQAGAMTWTPAG